MLRSFLGDLSLEYRTFNLNKINIEDEGMEDLEKFNLKYKINNSKCSLFDEIKQVYNFNKCDSKVSLNSSHSNDTKFDDEKNDSQSIFRIDLYLKRIIECMQKSKIKNLIIELGSLSSNNSNNFLILTKIKSIRSNWPKEKLVDMAVNIILDIIKKN